MITLDVIRVALVSMEYLSAQKSQNLSDDELLKLTFQDDLSMDSLDFLILLQHLETKQRLLVINASLYDCRTIQDLLNAALK